MKSQLFQTIGAVCLVGMAFVGTGCGDVSEEMPVALIHGERLELDDDFGFIDGAAAVNVDEASRLFARGPVLEEHYVDNSGSAREPAYEQVAELYEKSPTTDVDIEAFEPTGPTSPSVEESQDAFRSGCAPARNWKVLAGQFCSQSSAELVAFKTAESCEEGGHRMSRFICSSVSRGAEPRYSEVYTGMVLGGPADCLAMDEHMAMAKLVCGRDAKFHEVKGLKQCSDHGEEAVRYHTVRVICADTQE